MKILIKTLGLVGMLGLVFLFMGQARVHAQDDANVSFQTFYDELGSQGTWIQTNDYGYVWQPNVNDPNWRPYTDGQWANTDAGWTWASNEPWGWATYHYGRWVNLDGEGWVWVPGYTWAPAWVSWRYGDDYCGWAPLPPDTCLGIDYFGFGFGFGIGFHIGGDCDLAYGIGPAWYNFCPVAFFGDRDWRRHVVNCNDNFRIINRTRNVTNINVRNGRVRAGGPSLAAVNARAHTPFHQVALTRADRPGGAGLHGNSLAVYSPRVDPNSAKNARPRSVAQSLNNTRVNRGTDINRPLMVNSQVKSAGPTNEQVQAARQAQAGASRNARVATNATQPSRALNRPLTSFQPGTVAHNNNAAPGTMGISGNRTVGAAHNGAGTAPINGRTASSERYNPQPSTHAQGAVTAQRHYTSTYGANRTTPTRVAPAAVPQHNYAYQRGASHDAAPTHHYSSSSYHPTSSYHPASSFHPSAPSYHPQSSFHSSPSVSHFSGGGAPRASSGGGGGGRPGGGGGGGGGGHSGGNGGNGNGHH
jgi:uncharacterized membrane protein YgcG